jgi:hypothetical protein
MKIYVFYKFTDRIPIRLKSSYVILRVLRNVVLIVLASPLKLDRSKSIIMKLGGTVFLMPKKSDNIDGLQNGYAFILQSR